MSRPWPAIAAFLWMLSAAAPWAQGSQARSLLDLGRQAQLGGDTLGAIANRYRAY